MKRFTKLLAALLALLLTGVPGALAGETTRVNGDLPPKTAQETAEMVERICEEYMEDQALKDALQAEITHNEISFPIDEDEIWTYDICTLTHGGASMRFLMECRGEPDETGRSPLYITLHGGGGGPAEGNDSQWFDMFEYYKESVENGIYIACRGITDTWDLHFRPASYMLYDRLIQTMILNYGADANRVYLLGFSAGGDGVYQIAPRMADRFAAANMSSGHPNGVRLLNLSCCPISLQVGIRDYYDYDVMRSVRAAEFEKVLTGYRQTYGFGYEHRILVHVPAGHNYNDYGDSQCLVLRDPQQFAERAVAEDLLEVFLDQLELTTGERDVGTLSYDSVGVNPAFDQAMMDLITGTLGLEVTETNANAVRYVSGFTRDPSPVNLVWDLGTRAASREVDGFYWLEADQSVNAGIITACCDRETNTLTVTPDGEVNGDFAILFDPYLVDVSEPVRIVTPKGTFTVEVSPSEEEIRQSVYGRGDPSFAYVGRILYSQLGQGGQ